MTGGTNVAQSSLAVAARAGQAELHRTGHLSHLAGAIALRADHGCAAHRARAAASFANLLAHYIQPHLGSADGLPEIDVQTVFEIGPLLGYGCPRFPSPSAEKLAENVSKGSSSGSSSSSARMLGAARLVHVFGKIEPTESHAGVRLPRSAAAGTAGRNMVRIESVLIVDLAFFGVAQDIVSFLDLFETLLGRFVAGIQIGMIFARQLAIRLANLVFFCVPRHAKNFVIILLG